MNRDVDKVAESLSLSGAYAARMPRESWLRGGVTHPYLAANGERLGVMVPGQGLVLDADLRALGIVRPVPHVIERTPWMRLRDRCLDERGAVTTMQQLVLASQLAAIRNAYGVQIPGGLTGGGPTFGSLWHQNGGAWTAAPGLAVDNSAAGAWNPWMAPPPSTLTKYLLAMSWNVTPGAGTVGWGMLVLVDVLVVCGTIDCTVTTLTSINTPSVTRYISGIGVYASWWSTDTTPPLVFAADPTTASVVYTNQAGASSSTTFLIGDAVPSQQAFSSTGAGYGGAICQMPLASGDYGMRSVQSFQLTAAATSGAGSSVSLQLYKPLCFIASMTSLGATFEREVRSEPEILFPLVSDTVTGKPPCLSGYVITTSQASAGVVAFGMQTVDA